MGRLTGIWTPDYDFVTFAYDAGGRLTEQSLPNGTNTQFAWNPDNTLAQLKNRLGASDSQIVTQHDYSYDEVGNRATHIEKIGGTTTPYKYGYDALSRLIEVRNNSTNDLIEAFSYDSLGNRTTRTDGATTWYFNYDAANQLEEIRRDSAAGPLTAGFVYDDNGNLTQKCESGTVSRSATACSGSTILNLAYDSLDRLAQADKTGIANEIYQYDPQGRRIRKTVGGSSIDYLYAGANIYAEYTGSWSEAAATYTPGPGMDSPLVRNAADATRYYHQDGQGSVVAVTDSAGAVQGTQRFDAYGSPLSSTGSIPQYGYTGREPDATGLIYYRARYYDPSVGRFTQRDPLGFVDGVNRYTYALNSPVNFVDPYGTDSLGSTGGTSATYFQSETNNTNNQSGLQENAWWDPRQYVSVSTTTTSGGKGNTVSLDGNQENNSYSPTLFGMSYDLMIGSIPDRNESYVEMYGGLSKHTSVGVYDKPGTDDIGGIILHIGIGVGSPYGASVTDPAHFWREDYNGVNIPSKTYMSNPGSIPPYHQPVDRCH